MATMSILETEPKWYKPAYIYYYIILDGSLIVKRRKLKSEQICGNSVKICKWNNKDYGSYKITKERIYISGGERALIDFFRKKDIKEGSNKTELETLEEILSKIIENI